MSEILGQISSTTVVLLREPRSDEQTARTIATEPMRDVFRALLSIEAKESPGMKLSWDEERQTGVHLRVRTYITPL
jgi:hypothetical protein